MHMRQEDLAQCLDNYRPTGPQSRWAQSQQIIYTHKTNARQRCYRKNSRTGALLNAISALPISGRVLLLITTGLFAASLLLGITIQKSTKSQTELLIKSIRRSEDLFVETEGIVQEIRGSYRLKLSKLESIDTTALIAAHLNKWFILRAGRCNISFQQTASFLSGAPSYLVTLGLIGTFLGLIENLSELSGLVASSNSTDMSGLLGSMGTAFTVSLFGISFSLSLWLWEHILGIDTIEDRLISLIAAYLDGVVQNDVKRYSLVGEAVARIEKYLSEFLANFTDRVGTAIDKAMRDKLDDVFDTISKMARVSTSVIMKMEAGATRYEASSILFNEASQLVSKPNLSRSVIVAAEKLATSNQSFADSAEKLAVDLSVMREAIREMTDTWAEKTDLLATTIAKNQELLAGSTSIAKGIDRSSTRFAKSAAAIAATIPSLDENVKTATSIRQQAEDLMIQTQASTNSLVQASGAAERSATAVAAGTAELKKIVSMLSAAVRELRSPRQDMQSQENR